jgi:hypothetical protein
MMFLNIITPCTRPNNLFEIAKSINIPPEQYRWIVVFDANEIPSDIPKECEPYAIKVEGSVFGNGQRNYAIDLVEKGHLYFNDDDTTIHTDLWENIKSLDNTQFISFTQVKKDGTINTKGDIIANSYIDSHNFIVSKTCVGDSRWLLNRYEADGLFASECHKKTKSWVFIPKILSVYNSLK